ncbi:MAG: hypothetical protein V2A54_10950, partial [Bacteroidota bacterium]
TLTVSCTENFQNKTVSNIPFNREKETALVIETIVDSIVKEFNQDLKTVSESSAKEKGEKLSSPAQIRFISVTDTLWKGGQQFVKIRDYKKHHTEVVPDFYEFFLQIDTFAYKNDFIYRPDQIFKNKSFMFQSKIDEMKMIKDRVFYLNFNHMWAPVFNRSGNKCCIIFSYCCGMLCERGYTTFLEKVNGKWRIKKMVLEATA